MSHPVVILGGAGRMGISIARCLLAEREPALRLAAAIDQAGHPSMGQDMGRLAGLAEADVPLSDRLESVLSHMDVAIDFSSHDATAIHVRQCAEQRKPVVIGTTGLTPEEEETVRAASEQTAVVMAPNMSLGVNLLFVLVEQAAAALRDRGYDIEIIERHHRRKKDAPSGTAWGLGRAAAQGAQWALEDISQHGREGLGGERPSREIGFHAVRGGDIVGDHTVLFAGDGECIEFSHRATHRDTFAVGAVRAAAWVLDQPPGLYSMKDVLGL